MLDSLALTLTALLATAAAPATDGDASATTTSTMRKIGTAMFAWVSDQVEDGMPPVMMRSVVTQQADGATVLSPPKTQDTVDWAACTAASHADVVKELTPFYLDAIPEKDGWGHPLEFCLSKAKANAPQYVLGIRSPGRDGKFDGTTYQRGPFGVEQYDRDIVWLDGFFVAWPERK